jgi:dienelactone hydrolase
MTRDGHYNPTLAMPIPRAFGLFLICGLIPLHAADVRRSPARTLDSAFPFQPVSNATEWEARRVEIAHRIQISAGLWPMPSKTPLNPVIHGAVDRGDHQVERVFFESLPGHFVSGSLYRPAGPSLANGLKNGKRAAVLCPHGHWKNGRFYDAGESKAQEEINLGAEVLINPARFPVQARCVQLARMGCTVFLYDMVGYADSIQFPEHRNGPRPEMSSSKPGEWGFVSPQATARLQTNFGLQTWNSLRALDFLLALPEIDPERVLVTGASGGATQTMMLGAIDARVRSAFPCVMVSTAMQGGCTCENGLLLRIGQGNIDIAAAITPRPLGLTAADDWTVELEKKGHPDLLNLYKMLGASDHYEAHFDIQFKHNYNHVSRTHMYQFANRHLSLGLPAPVAERDFKPLSQEELTVWTKDHPAPSGEQVGPSHEKAVCRWWEEDARKQIQPLLRPSDPATLERARNVLGPALRTMIGRDLPTAGSCEFEITAKEKPSDHTKLTGLIRLRSRGEEVPAVFLHPSSWNGRVILWVTPQGSAALETEPSVTKLLNEGNCVAAIDVFGTTDPKLTENPAIPYSANASKPGEGWQLSPVYFYGYNDSLFARRVHDLLTTISFVRHHPDWKVQSIAVAGMQGAGHWVAAARAIAGSGIDRCAIATQGFRFADLPSHWHADFLPGAVKYGDLNGLLVQSAPHPLWVQDAGEETAADLSATYGVTNSTASLSLDGGDAVAFLTKN